MSEFRERLSTHFTLTELTKSTAADRYGVDNSCPSQEIYDNLERLCLNILEPVRKRFGQFVVTSGYRSPKVNELVGGAKTSQHPKGQAADFEVGGTSNFDVANWIAESLDFDQLILEFYIKGKPNSGWVHCSYISKEKNRRQILTVHPKFGTFKGLVQ